MVVLKAELLKGLAILIFWTPLIWSPMVSWAETTQQPSHPLSHASAEFLAETAQGNLAGMTLGFLAIQKSDSDRVRVYARYVIDDCVKLNKELMELARRKKVLVPLDTIVAPNPALTALSRKSASEFDKAFILFVISEGERTRAVWQKHFGEAEDGDLKDFASQALTDLSHRLTEARELGREIGLAASQLNPPPPVGERRPMESPSREPLQTPAPTM